MTINSTNSPSFDLGLLPWNVSNEILKNVLEVDHLDKIDDLTYEDLEHFNNLKTVDSVWDSVLSGSSVGKKVEKALVKREEYLNTHLNIYGKSCRDLPKLDLKRLVSERSIENSWFPRLARFVNNFFFQYRTDAGLEKLKNKGSIHIKSSDMTDPLMRFINFDGRLGFAAKIEQTTDQNTRVGNEPVVVALAGKTGAVIRASSTQDTWSGFNPIRAFSSEIETTRGYRVLGLDRIDRN